MTDSRTADLLRQALALHRQGDIGEAAARYADVLRADSRNVDAHYYLGILSCQQGRFAEGVERAQRVLSVDPNHPRAHILLGRALSALGRGQEALDAFQRAITLAPELPEAHSHRADLLSDLGRHAEAVESYDRALALAPERAEDWFNRAVALDALGRDDEALASADRAVDGKSDSAQFHLLRAKLLSQLHRYEEAQKSADRALAIDPALAEAWVGRGNVAASLEQWGDALAAYDKALGLKPDLAQAWCGRGNVCLAAGKPEPAIQAIIRSLELGETAQAKALFVQCLGFLRIAADDGRLRRLLLRALSEAWARPHALMSACASVLKLNAILNECVVRAQSAWPQRVAATGWLGLARISGLANDQLFVRALEAAPIPDVGIERLLTNVRQFMLMTARYDEGPEERLLEFYCSVARQCFINEYVYSVSDSETEQLQHLRAELERSLVAGGRCSPLWVVVAGAYFPLHALANARSLLERSWPRCLDALLELQLREPAEERRLSDTIPALTAISGALAQEVRQQYEDNPYPRWINAGPPAIPGALRHSRPMRLDDVLIAGCGTGLVTIELARHQPQARILAIDLSRASLAYAKRMAQKLGLDNIEFAQADIMELGGLDRQFDFVEASGVLHHLAEPWLGWRALLARLRPGGVMQLGLYSQAARRNVAAIRELIAFRGYRPTVEDIRRCREEIMATEDGSLLKSVTGWSDFFATSDCRDLLFHVHEQPMSLPEIKSFVDAEDLEFTGFILPSPVLHQFRLRFPEPAAVVDLDLWQKFEFEFPEAFAAMYQFGIRKRA